MFTIKGMRPPLLRLHGIKPDWRQWPPALVRDAAGRSRRQALLMAKLKIVFTAASSLLRRELLVGKRPAAAHCRPRRGDRVFHVHRHGSPQPRGGELVELREALGVHAVEEPAAAPAPALAQCIFEAEAARGKVPDLRRAPRPD